MTDDPINRLPLPPFKVFLFIFLYCFSAAVIYAQPLGVALASDWTTYKEIVGTIQSGLTALALVIGAVWAVIQIFKGRVFKSKLEPVLTGKIVSVDGEHFLLFTLEVKNVGSTKVSIQQNKTGVVISPLTEVTSDGIRWLAIEKSYAEPALGRHAWIEPGEPVSEDHLYPLASPLSSAYKLQLNLVGDYTFIQKLRRWIAGKKLRDQIRANIWSAILIVVKESEKAFVPVLSATMQTTEDKISRKIEELLKKRGAGESA